MAINTDCRYFNGSKPCEFNKKQGQKCLSCHFYSPVKERILIIKLDSIGDVLRTTTITPKIKQEYPDAYVVWITREEALDLVKANPDVDEVWPYDCETLNVLQVVTWDYVFSCSNDLPSAALASLAKARREKIGFLLSEDGVLLPTNEMARLWLEMAAFDSLKKANQLSFQDILYGICGFSGPIHHPRLSLPSPLKAWASSVARAWCDQAGLVIGVNTGAGNRWRKKMPGVEQMISIILDILDTFPQSRVVLLGGPQELEKNRQIKEALDSPRLHDAGCGHSLLQFAGLISQCQVLLCGDTLSLHIASALESPTVALFGPTSMTEIYSYNGLITKLSANSLDCLCCYNNCDKSDDCMTAIPNKEIMEHLARQLQRRYVTQVTSTA